jgi:hypothetical protein
LENGIKDLKTYTSKIPSDSEARDLLTQAESVNVDITKLNSLNNEKKVEKLSEILGICSTSAEMRMKRADIYMATGQKELAMGDLLYTLIC